MAENFPNEQAMETKSWAIPADGVTLDELTLALSKAGVPVLERDEENNKLLVGYGLVGEIPPLHTYDETCCVEKCKANANHVIPDGSHWCDLHLQGVRALLERNPDADPHELCKQWEG